MCSDSSLWSNSSLLSSILLVLKRSSSCPVLSILNPVYFTYRSRVHRSFPSLPSVQWHSPVRQQSRDLLRHRPNRSRSRNRSRARRVPIITDQVPYFDQTPTQHPPLPSLAPSTRPHTPLAKTPRTRLPSHTAPAGQTTCATTHPLPELKDSLPSRVLPWPNSS